MNAPLILIDNGHGSNTPGKRSPDGRILEYKYTREIAQEVYKKLKILGYKVKLITPEEIDIPLSTRVLRVNTECAKQNCIFISVHCNAAGSGQWMNATGWSCYTTKGKTKSDILAEYLYSYAEKFCLEQKIRRDVQDGDSDWEENFYVLKNTKCPAVLTENFFMDNKKDVEYLLSERGKQDIINLHVQGIVEYINNN